MLFYIHLLGSITEDGSFTVTVTYRIEKSHKPVMILQIKTYNTAYLGDITKKRQAPVQQFHSANHDSLCNKNTDRP
jgi:hypothetical protein